MRTRWFCPTPNCSNGWRAGATRPAGIQGGAGSPLPAANAESGAHGVTRPATLKFHGQVAVLSPHLENGDKELSFTHYVVLPDGKNHSIAEVKFFNRQPPLALVNGTFYLLRNAPPPAVLKYLAGKPSVPVRKLSHRLLLHLRKTQSNHGVNWEQLCVTHKAAPQFVFELLDDTVRLRLLAKSQRDQSVWFWNGHEWRARHEPDAIRPGRQTGNPRRPAPGTGGSMAAQTGLVHLRTRPVDWRRE